tara:strand:+ start:442 stop:1485 length:1044 start_codon:yes stop_codon:yes gene_type:complete
MQEKIIFYANVAPRFLDKWEYYIADIDMLKECFEEVLLPRDLKELFLLCLKYPNIKIYCWWWHRSFPAILIGKLLRKKIYCTGAIHMYDYSGNRTFYNRNLFYRLFTTLSLRLSSHNIFISKDQFLAITSALKVNNPELIYSSLTKKSQTQNKSFLLKKSTLNRNEINLLFIGWLSKYSINRKSLIITLEAIKLIRDEIDKRVTINICGTKSDGVEFLKHYINQLKIEDNIVFNFDISQDLKDSFYKKSDLLVTPSYMEGFGNATLEAMSFGCPVLVSRFGASPEVVGETGYIINHIDPKSIAKVIKNYSELPFSERLNMRKLAYERAYNTFGFNKKVKSFKKILKT